ncbi:MAG: efflux RND transporter periplasmic adaptor subunit [Actinomyces sp.]|nr:efflux RND transporter periplasmic adaptor subunit [Actinomyces sp.]
MSAHRSRGATVMSVLRILVWTVIAAALVKFAFFPATAEAEDQVLDPSAQYGQMTVVAETGTITNALSLEGTIRSDPATTVRATLDGEVTAVYAEDGQVVAQGDPILLIQKEIPGQDQVTTDAEGNQQITPAKSEWRNAWINAPAAGTLQLAALLGQQFAIGDIVGTIQPPTFSAVATLTPDQMYRIQDVPDTATITITDGPAPFECSALQILTPKAGADSGTGGGTSTTPQPGAATSGQGDQSTAIQATCAVPADQKVFPGLQVKVDLVAGEAVDVQTLPVTAVEGRFQTGWVYLPGADPATPEKVQVNLGLSDGTRIEIKDGLSDGQEVLEFVPGQQETEMQCNPMTGEGC